MLGMKCVLQVVWISDGDCFFSSLLRLGCKDCFVFLGPKVVCLVGRRPWLVWVKEMSHVYRRSFLYVLPFELKTGDFSNRAYSIFSSFSLFDTHWYTHLYVFF